MTREYARQRIVVDTDGAPGPKAVTAALEPAKVLTGRITYADTGKPVPHAVVEIYAYTRPQGGPGYTSHYETDDQGNYRANPISGVRYTMLGRTSPEGQPYLNASSGDFPFAWPKGKLEHRVDMRLAPGHGAPRQGHRGRHGPARGRGGAPLRRAAATGRTRPAPGAAPRGRARTARTSSPSGPTRAPWSSWAPARTTCSRRSAGGCSTRAGRAGLACTPTPSSPATSSPARTAGRSTSSSAGARR